MQRHSSTIIDKDTRQSMTDTKPTLGHLCQMYNQIHHASIQTRTLDADTFELMFHRGVEKEYYLYDKEKVVWMALTNKVQRWLAY